MKKATYIKEIEFEESAHKYYGQVGVQANIANGFGIAASPQGRIY